VSRRLKKKVGSGKDTPKEGQKKNRKNDDFIGGVMSELGGTSPSLKQNGSADAGVIWTGQRFAKQRKD